MIISHKNKFIFICNGKTGTTSIEKALASYDEMKDFYYHVPGLHVKKHLPPAVAKAYLPSEIWDTYFKFVFVRDPYDWVVSNWRFNFISPVFPIKASVRRPYLVPKYVRDYRRRLELHRKEKLDVDDIDFLYNHLKQFRAMPLADSYFQHSYVYDSDGRKMVDMVGRFESLKDDVEQVREKIGVDFELPHVNKTKRRDADSSLTAEGKARIRELWSRDFELLGY